MVNIITVNVQGLRQRNRRQTAFNLLQETHWTGELENEIRNDWGHDIFSNGTANAREQLYYLTHV